MIIRKIQEKDINLIAEMEREISIISFGDEAITELDFHIRKLQKAMPKEVNGMMVLEIEKQIVGWMWMTPRINSVSNEKYVNFKSFYIAEKYRGTDYVNKFVEAGMKYCRDENVKTIICKLNVNNLPARILWKSFGFEPTHLTMEYKFDGRE
ncbi:UNVERIFIED_CONTAM: ribosomal protein S18 acetylase RimI-like enzyme [Acetivibrio alkalicellulosi]